MSFPQIIVPDWVAASLEQEAVADAELGRQQWLNAAVKELDPDLSVVWINDRIPAHIAGRLRVTPGRWHVKRTNPDGIEPSYKAITGPGGEYRSCDSGVLEELRRQDMWSGDVARGLFEANKRREAEREREEERQALARREDIEVNVKALLAPSTLVNTDVRWSNKPSGKRGRRR